MEAEVGKAVGKLLSSNCGETSVVSVKRSLGPDFSGGSTSYELQSVAAKPPTVHVQMMTFLNSSRSTYIVSGRRAFWGGLSGSEVVRAREQTER